MHSVLYSPIVVSASPSPMLPIDSVSPANKSVSVKCIAAYCPGIGMMNRTVEGVALAGMQDRSLPQRAFDGAGIGPS
jgi:hypothetical protein